MVDLGAKNDGTLSSTQHFLSVNLYRFYHQIVFYSIVWGTGLNISRSRCSFSSVPGVWEFQMRFFSMYIWSQPKKWSVAIDGMICPLAERVCNVCQFYCIILVQFLPDSNQGLNYDLLGLRTVISQQKEIEDDVYNKMILLHCWMQNPNRWSGIKMASLLYWLCKK